MLAKSSVDICPRRTFFVCGPASISTCTQTRSVLVGVRPPAAHTSLISIPLLRRHRLRRLPMLRRKQILGEAAGAVGAADADHFTPAQLLDERRLADRTGPSNRL